MIYFDNASSTKPFLKTVEIYKEECLNSYANPNSIHALGMHNMTKINRIKANILKLFKLDSKYEVIFTSGATESNNLAILGYCRKNKNKGKHIITSKIEHESVLNVFAKLEGEGFKVDYLNVDSNGNINLDELKDKIDNDTILVALMSSNNEVGSVLDIKKSNEIISKFPKCVFYSDVAQAVGKVDINYSLIDMFGFSMHKIHGLKGSGLLIKKKNISLEPIIFGGGQENGLRSGTLDFPIIVSTNYTLEEVMNNVIKNNRHVKEISDYLKKELGNSDEIEVNNINATNPYIVSISLKNKLASVVVEALSNKEIYVNSVSACNSKNDGPSYVLLAMGMDQKRAKNVIRISLSEENTLDEAIIFVKELNEILSTIKGVK